MAKYFHEGRGWEKFRVQIKMQRILKACCLRILPSVKKRIEKYDCKRCDAIYKNYQKQKKIENIKHILDRYVRLKTIEFMKMKVQRNTVLKYRYRNVHLSGHIADRNCLRQELIWKVFEHIYLENSNVRKVPEDEFLGMRWWLVFRIKAHHL